MTMRRFPAIGLAITLLALPLAARAAVPDPRVQRQLVGGVGPASNATAIGDVTGDDVADLIVARGDGTVAVFEGPLSGTLPTAPMFTVTPSAHSDAYRLAVGDLDGDGFGDLVVAAVGGDPASGIDIFLGTGRALPPAPDTTLTPIDVRDVAVADLNGDALDDLLYTQVVLSKTEVVLATQDTGVLKAGVTLEADAPASGLSIGDIDGDTLNDFALDGTMSASIPVYLQSGLDHSFSRTNWSLPPDITGVTGVVLSDVDTDTYDDLLVVTDADALSWALADGSGFGAFSPAVTAAPVSAKEVGDLNGDNLADLATFGTDGSVRIYLQQAGGGLGAACAFPGQATPGGDAATAIGDLSGDGATDLVDADVAGTSGGAWLSRQLTGTELLATSIDAVASKTRMRAGKSVAVSGTFHDPDGGCLRNGSVTLTRTGPGGTVLDGFAIASDGTFAFSDAPAASGTYDYVVSFAGDETHATSASSTMSVTVTKNPTSLTLKATKPTITFGETTTLRATLTGGDASSEVVFELASGGTWQTIDTRPVNADGVATLKVQPSGKTRYRAEFLVTPARSASLSTAVTVQVHATMISRMIGKGVQQGAYTVYACCTAYLYVKLRPLHPNVKWTAIAQYYDKGKWRPLGSGGYAMERDGDAAIFLNAPQGYRYRVKGTFAGDTDHLGATSKWNYFKFR
jgi:hypothetical protein